MGLLSERERAERFLQWADEHAVGAEARYNRFGEGSGLPVTSLWYHDTPEPGWGVGLTYGLSLLPHSGSELLVVVRSEDPVWVWALADFVDRNRTDGYQLGAGHTIRFGAPISGDSPMDAFFITRATSVLGGDDVVHLDTDDHIRLLQAVPIRSSEVPLLRQLGVAAFAARAGETLLDPRREPLA